LLIEIDIITMGSFFHQNRRTENKAETAASE